MWGIKDRADDFCCRLSPDRNFAGMVIGDNWSAAFIVHVDYLGPVHIIRWHKEKIDLRRGHSPSLAAVKETVAKCWKALKHSETVEYSKFLLCLPGWLCRSMNANSAIAVNGKWANSKGYGSRVDEFHIRKLEESICKKNLPPDGVVVDFVPGSFTVDDGRKMRDPLGCSTRTLSLDAHLVVSDGYWTREIVSCLRGEGVRVDGIMSAYAAAAELLSPEERTDNAVAVDVGALNTYLSFYENGVLCSTAVVKDGTDAILTRVAGRLGLSTAELAGSIEQMKLLLCDNQDEIDASPLFVWRTKQPAIRDLDNAATMFTESLAGEVWRAIDETQRKCGVDFRSAAFFGNDNLVVRVLLQLMKERNHIRCRWGIPVNAHKNEERDAPGYAHMIGLVRRHGQCRGDAAVGANVQIEAYGDTVVTSIMDKVGSGIIESSMRIFTRQTRKQSGFTLRPSVSSATSLLQAFEPTRYISNA